MSFKPPRSQSVDRADRTGRTGHAGRVGRIIRWVLATVLILVIVAGGAFTWVARRSLPVTSGRLTVSPAGPGLASGVSAPVNIYRDSYSVPHIFAQTMEDAFFAQGYVQAQDRLWEMDLSRRAVRGRLAEIFGESYVSADVFLRTLGFLRTAEGTYGLLDAGTKSLLQAYADGVNAFLKDAGGELPLEFTILGYKPDPWTPVDSLAIGKYMAWVLGGNLSTELFFMALNTKVGPERAAELFPVYPEYGPITIPSSQSATPVSRTDEVEEETSLLAQSPALPLQTFLDMADTIDQSRFDASTFGLGSNDWVLSGSRTTTGQPLLANDMHLEIKQPAIWYQNHISVAGKMNVTGVMFPGIPGVVAGHNDHIAWGETNVGPDVQDLYIEKPNPKDPTEFEYEGKWEKATVIPEDIKVKGKTQPVHKEILVTRHGPIITGLFPGADQPLALRWTAYEKSFEVKAILAMDQARNWQEWTDALKYFWTPAQNFVYADVDGNIGYKANGLYPIRKKGNGLFPVPGWAGEYEWQGYVPMDQVPTLFNPPDGFIATANNRVAGPDYPYFISSEWSSPYRIMSIRSYLTSKPKLSLDDMQALQNYTGNAQAKLLAPVIQKALKEKDVLAEAGLPADQQTAAKAALVALDSYFTKEIFNDAAGSVGPSVYHDLYRKLLEATFQDEMGPDLFKRYIGAGTATNTLDRMLTGADPNQKWFDDIATSGKVETAGDCIRKAFGMAVAELTKVAGPDEAKWTWGRLHTITFDHPMGARKPLDKLFNVGPLPVDGSWATPKAESFSLGSAPFPVTSAAPWRFTVDLSAMGGAGQGSMDVMAVGESGQRFSSHYADQRNLWMSGKYKTMPFTEDALKKAPGVQVLQMVPASTTAKK